MARSGPQSGASAYFLFAGSSFLLLILYGLLEERVVKGIFRKRFALPIAAFRFLSFFVFALCARGSTGKVQKGETTQSSDSRTRKGPIKVYLLLGGLMASSAALGNIALQAGRLPYTVKILFKSSKPIVTLLMSNKLFRREYDSKELVCVGSMVLGLVLFSLGGAKADSTRERDFSPMGLGIMTVVILMDGLETALRVELLSDPSSSSRSENKPSQLTRRGYGASKSEVLQYQSGIASCFLLAASAYCGELWDSVAFAHSHQCFPLLGALVLSNYLGGLCSMSLLQRFGPITQGITSTSRKLLQIGASYLFFPEDKLLTVQHGAGVLLFTTGLLYKHAGHKQKQKEPQQKQE